MSAAFPDLASIWWRELRALVPEAARDALFDDPAKLSCLLRPAGDVFELAVFERDRITLRSQMARGELSREALQRLVSPNSVSRNVRIGLEIEAALCFRRHFDAPEEALDAAPALLIAEIDRKTPFKAKDVVSGYRILESRAGVARIEHLIVKNAYVESALKDASLLPGQIDFLCLHGESGDPQYFDLRSAQPADRLPQRLLAFLALGAVVLGGAYVGLSYVQNDRRIAALDEAIERLRPRLAEARTRAAATTAARQEDEQVASLRASGRFLDIWAALTRLLPNDCWLTELRLSQSKDGEKIINLSGFADSPAELVTLLEASGLFANTTLGSAVTFDPVERKQQFHVQTSVRPNGAFGRGAP